MKYKHKGMNKSEQRNAEVDNTKQDPELLKVLNEHAAKFGVELQSAEFAAKMDEIDPLRDIRAHFTFPTMKDLPNVDLSLIENPDEECIYLCGNSLGLKPKRADKYQKEVLDDWGKMGVFAHTCGHLPAARCDLYVKNGLALVAGAHPDEVVCMNALTINMHILFTTFYRPTSTRYKIMIEEQAFPSDRYGAVSQLKLHGYSEEDGLIILQPRDNEHTLRTEDILARISEHGSSLAVVFLSGVHYYTGQKFDIETITKCAQAEGCIVGWDLAHAVGNVELKLHDWNVDFACWCSYKYLNSGPGGIGAAFVHRRHHQGEGPMLTGWWGNREETRFEMKHSVDLAYGADAYRLSNPPPSLVALCKAGLEIFQEASIERLLAKQYLITGYLEYLIDHLCLVNGNNTKPVEMITPRNPCERGTQISVIFPFPLKQVHENLEKRGVVCDIRSPSVMRLAPVASYISYSDVHRFFTTLQRVVAECNISSL